MNICHYIRKSNETVSVLSGNSAREIFRIPLQASLILIAITMLSGCVMAHDRTTTTSFVSTESGYPDMAVSKRKMARPGRVIKRTLDYSFLGRAPYICTPSGFGRTSGCFLRRG
jgi:hypothetical protein